MALIAALLMFAPLVRGGNRPLAAIALELLGLACLVWTVRRRPWPGRMSRLLLLCLGGLLALPGLQLVPLPPGASELLDRGLPEPLGGAPGPTGDWQSVSLVPYLTEASWLALLPPIGLFAAVMARSTGELSGLVRVFIAMAVLQALLGLLQYGAGPQSMLRFGYEPYGDSAIGTYANRSHLAGLLVMALPLALALLGAAVARLGVGAGRREQGARRRAVWLRGQADGETNALRVALFAAVVIVILLGVVFARSRTGIALAMTGLVLSAAALGRELGAGLSMKALGVVATVAGALASAIGLTPVLLRFGRDALEDGRWAILEASLHAARVHLPLGSGIGTYPEVIRGFHPAAIGGEHFINHAHNDYVEWLVEGGLPAMVVLLGFVVVYLGRWRSLWRVRSVRPLHLLQLGAGIGLLLLALFGLTDYNLRIPANALYFAFLGAVFLHPGEVAERRRLASARRRSRPPSPPEPGPSSRPGGEDRPCNPFAE